MTDKDKDFQEFQDAVDKAVTKHKLDKKDLTEKLPRHDTKKHGVVKVVSLMDIALTEEGELTKTAFFDNLSIDRENTYRDITLTQEEAKSLSIFYRKLSTGVNAVVPLQCTASACPFKDDCWYYLNDKAIPGTPCLIEYDLLNYTTARLVEEFEVEPKQYTEVMLIQELAELQVYEMRATRTLSKPENASLMGYRLKFSPDGEEIQEETEHWAWNLKEKIKNRRMRILDALMATRKNKATLEKEQEEQEQIETYQQSIKNIKDKLDKLTSKKQERKEINAQEVQFKEEK